MNNPRKARQKQNAYKRKPPKLRKFLCPVTGCGHAEYKYRRMDRHISATHVCHSCGLRFFDVENHNCDTPAEQEGGGNGLGPDNLQLGEFTESSSSHGGIIKSFSYKNHERLFLVEDLVDLVTSNITSILSQCLSFFHSIKVQFTISIYLIHEKNNDIIKNSFNSPFITLSHVDYIEELIVTSTTYIIDSVNTLNERGSGWNILRIDEIVLTIAKSSPIRGGSSNTLRPEVLKRRKGLLDFSCPEDDCFIYAFLSALHHQDLPMSRRKIFYEYNVYKPLYNFDCLEAPVSPSKLKAFEEMNQISVCLFTHEKKDIYPMRIAHNKYPRVVLLLYTQTTGKPHYISIIDFSSLVGEGGVSRHSFCYYCFNKFLSEEACKRHMDLCAEFGEQIIEFPKPNQDGTPKFKEFSSFYKAFKVPFYMVADLETTLEPLSTEEARALEGKGTKIEFRKKLDCMAYGVALIGTDNDYIEYHSYVGPNAMEKFLKKCFQLANFALSFLKMDVGFPELTPEDWVKYHETEICPCCKKNFNEYKLVKVFHHLHHLGTLAKDPIVCSICNLALKNRRFIPCLLHSAATLDFREICKGLHYPCVTDIQIIPRSSQKFLAITLNKTVRFLDSYSKLPASLSSLIELTKKSGIDKFKYTLKEFESFPGDISTLISKQLNPYDYFDSIERLKETQLPPKSAFFNSLTESDITDEDYRHAQNMFELVGCKTLGDYLSFYLKIDVFTLIDVVSNFRDQSFDRYKLDMLQYLSGSSYSFDSCLYNSNARFEHMQDIEFLRTIQKAAAGGIVHVSTRLLESNLKGYEGYKPNLPQKQILYLDFASLYASCMKEPLYMDKIEKLTKEEIARLSANNYETLRNFSSEEEGMFLTVDLKTPIAIHDRLYQLPFAPEKLKVARSMLSEHQIDFINDHPASSLGSMASERLILNFFDKKNYVVYHKLLIYYVKMGMQIEELHGGYKFRVKSQVKDYIETNLEERRRATDPIVKNLIKLNLNSFFGFSLRAKQNDMMVRVALNPVDAERYISDVRFRGLVQVKPNVTVILLKPHKAVFDLPYAFGCIILAISKLKLYRTVHTELAELFDGRQFTLAMCDTDSILFSVTLFDHETSIYPILKKRAHLFDFSACADPNFQDSSNYLVAGCLKNECEGNEIRAVVVLSCKCYSISTFGDQKNIVRLKGIAKYKHKYLDFPDYYDCLMNQTVNRISMNMLQSRNHQVYSVTMTKISLSALNTKTFYIDPQGINSLPFGHYRIRYFK